MARTVRTVAGGAIVFLVALYGVRYFDQRSASTEPVATLSPAHEVVLSPPGTAPAKASGATGAGTLDFRWPGNDCWQVYRGDQVVAGSCGAGKQALQAGKYTVKGQFGAPFVPFETTIGAGATTAVAIGGIFDFKWPGNDCWQVYRGDQVIAGSCGAGKQALQAGKYTVKGQFAAPFVPFETTIGAGVTTAVAIGGIFDFKWPGNDCWQVYRGDQVIAGRCGAGKQALQAGKYTVKGQFGAPFEPFAIEVKNGATVSAP
jgi:hypothetical protein